MYMDSSTVSMFSFIYVLTYFQLFSVGWRLEQKGLAIGRVGEAGPGSEAYKRGRIKKQQIIILVLEG